MHVFTASTWSAVSRLLDEALDLDPAARPQWLAELARTQPDLAPMLQRMLAAHARIETAELLKTLPQLDRPSASTAGASAPGPWPLGPGALSPGDRVGPYRLIRELGAGGMAHVWLAARADGAFERDIALKLPQVSLLRRHLADRFARERDILARLEHPHIARLYDAGVAADGTPYLAMEYVQGQPIHAWCDERKLDVSARLALFEQVLSAVQYAHANLVIHRDLKPSNILVTPEGQVRLLDFGIAKLVADDERAHETQLTQVSGRAMTPDYASPEQITGQPLTIGSDIYSLGVVLFELLTGARPYRLRHKSAAHLELAILETDPPPPSTCVDDAAAAARGASKPRLAATLASDLDAVVLKALAKDPAQRYTTIAALADDLARWREGRPVLARRPTVWYRAAKFVRRNALAVGATSLAVVLLVGATVFALTQARQARLEADKANAVKAFLTTLFETNSVDQTQAAARTQRSAQQLLEEGARRVDAQFAEQPELRAELQGVIGQLLHDLVQTDQALAVREQRLRSLEQAGAPALARAIALKELASSLLQKGDDRGAQARLDAAVKLLDGRSGRAERIEYWTLRSLRGRTRSLAGTVADGAPDIESAAEALESLARGSLAHAQALFHLGELRSLSNDVDEAVALFDRSMALFEKNLGPRSFRVAQQRYVLANALASQRRIPEATAHVRQALDMLDATAGPDHPSTGLVSLFLGRLRSMTGDTAEARTHLLRAQAIFEKRSADIDPLDFANAYLFVGESLLDEGRVAEAAQPLEQAMAMFAKLPMTAQRTVADTIFARYLLDAGRYAEAEAALERARAHRASIYGPTHPAVASLTNRLGLVQLAAGDHARARATFDSIERSQEQREATFGSPRHLARLNRAQLDVEQGNYAAALPVYRAMYDAFHRLPEGARERLPEIAVNQRLARTLIGLGRAQEAKPLLARADELAAVLYPHSPLRIQLDVTNAQYLAATGDRTGARRRLAQARESLERQPILGPHIREAVRRAERQIGR